MIFSVVKLDLFIRAFTRDHILALEKTTRTPRVHLVNTCDLLYIIGMSVLLICSNTILFYYLFLFDRGTTEETKKNLPILIAQVYFNVVCSTLSIH